jgi:hypothetical protein
VLEARALEATISDVPRQDLCETGPSRGLQCQLDYRKFPNNLQRYCEEAGGQPALTYYMATCNALSYSLQLAVSDEPGCVASSCQTDDTKTLLEMQANARVMARWETADNLNCTLSLFRYRQPPPSEPSTTPSDSPSSPPTTVNGVSSACQSSYQYLTSDTTF